MTSVDDFEKNNATRARPSHKKEMTGHTLDSGETDSGKTEPALFQDIMPLLL